LFYVDENGNDGSIWVHTEDYCITSIEPI
jgi:hypothetical protein